MEAEELYQKLQKEFPEAVGEVNLEAKDPFVMVEPAHLHQLMRFLKENEELAFDFLSCISGVDYQEHFEVVYHLFSYSQTHKAVVKTQLPRENPEIPSMVDLWPAADWLEREVYDLVGIIFRDHPHLHRILLPEDWEGHPLRKDYEDPEQYHGIPHNVP